MEISLTVEAASLNKSLEFIDEFARKQLEKAMEALSIATMAKAHELAHDKLHTTLPDYLNGLDMNKQQGPNWVVYTLTLSQEAGWIEDGGPQAGYDMKAAILAGPRSLHIGAKGQRYKHVPFRHHPYSKVAYPGRRGQIQNEVRRVISEYGLDKIIKASGNKALQGKVASVTSKDIMPEVRGLTKYQKTYRKKTESTYMTFRTISDNSPPGSWVVRNPWMGAKIFPELEKFVREEMHTIINALV